MKEKLSNRPLLVLVALFTASSGWLLHENPFGAGSIAWPVAVLLALLGNLFFAYVIAAWAAPYLASTGGRAGAAAADPRSVARAQRWTAGGLMLFGSLGLLAVTLASKQLVITPTDRLEKNAELVRHTVESQAPEQYQHQLAGADTWKMSARTYRTCVPTPGSLETGWCVLVQAQEDGSLKVVRYGPGKSNAAQALEWHPELKNQERRGY
jgi:hypothetical protein